MYVTINKRSGTGWRAVLVLAAVALALILVQENALVAAQKALVDINTASVQELEGVKGIGAARAHKIIAGRPYKSLDELTKAGLSAKQIEGLKPFLTVSQVPSALAAPAPMTKKPEAAAPAKPVAKQPAATPAAPVDLNTADQKALEALPGVGPALAKKIIAARPFQSVNDLSKVKGMSKSKIDALKDQVVVNVPKAAAPAAKPAPAPVAPSAAEKPTAPTKPSVAEKPAAPEKPAAAMKLAPGEKININTATKEELDKLPGIGPVKAQAIIEGRPYANIEDIMKVKGIKQGEFNKIKENITVK